MVQRARCGRVAGWGRLSCYSAAVWEWARGDDAPLLSTALAAFDCRLASAETVGSHGVLFGAIVGVAARDMDVEPLLNAHGGYGGFSNDARSSNDEGVRLRAEAAFPDPGAQHDWR